MSATNVRDRLALVIAVVAFACGLLPMTIARYEAGIQLGLDSTADHLVVQEVDPLGPAAQDGVHPGLIVVDLNGNPLIDLPQPILSSPDPDGNQTVIGGDPVAPQNRLGPDALASLLNTPIRDLHLIEPWDLANGTAAGGYAILGFSYPGWRRLDEATVFILFGLAILLFGAWWVATGRAGESLRGLAIPLVTALATPFLVASLADSGLPVALAVAGLLLVVAMIPLALGLADRIEPRTDRRFAHAAIAVFSTAATIVALAYVTQPNNRDALGQLRWGFTGAIPIVPGLIAAGPLDIRAGRMRAGAGGLLRSAELAIAGATPLFGLLAGTSLSIWPLALWVAAIALADRFTVRPLARIATRATLQRDLVVAATEAERARVAADIHDDALQELTLLVRRLESSGDAEGAEIGRTVADKLRAICGDLRLPILDDLGVGPALDWLVLRIERLAGGEVRLERADDARHNPDVELAIFRVAQEALANAVKHGKPPIVVRYRSTAAGISLAIDDAGPGIAENAPETAEKAGRFGLLNMAQRAEQIGAILDVKRWPSGGTHVALEWRPR
ncbi:MAG TPA: ATP-binding protein [Candidatus Limnocylindrales bacterium]|nr:ATP-binding protein [Candidatus Limnocylindrales bacterium]